MGINLVRHFLEGVEQAAWMHTESLQRSEGRLRGGQLSPGRFSDP